MSATDAGLFRRPISVKEVASSRVDSNSTGLIQNGAVEDGSSHAARMVNVGADDFNFGTGTVYKVEIVAEPIE